MKYLLLLLLVSFWQTVAAQPELPGLVLYSKMESSCEFKDEIPESPANGVLIDISLAPDRNNTPASAFAFGVNTSYITLGVVNKLKLTGDKSISFWIKPAITGSNRTGSIFTYGNGTVIAYQEQNSVGKLNISFGNTLYLSADLSTEWQAVTITFEKDYTSTKSKASLYIDGIAKGVAEQNKTAQDFSNAIAILGPASQSNLSNGFRGSLDEFKMYNRALTATEILNTPLPAKIEFFTGQRMNGVVQLTWKTSMEENVSHFDIQRSSDSLLFQTVSRVLSGKINYLAFDSNPLTTDAWYRLQIVEKDGRTTYSDVIKIGPDSAVATTMSIFPNPATSTLNFRGFPADHTIKIISATGTIVKQLQLTNKINISDIRPGFYYILIYDKEGYKKMISKFIKRNDR